MSEPENLRTWEFSFLDDRMCVDRIGFAIEDDPRWPESVTKPLLDYLETGCDVFDLKRWVSDQYFEAEARSLNKPEDSDEKYAEETEYWDEALELIKTHETCDCSSFEWEHAGEDWKAWISKEILPKDGQSWLLLEGVRGRNDEVEFPEPVSISELAEATGWKDWSDFKAEYDPAKRTVAFMFNRSSAGILYCPTPDERELVTGCQFYEEAGAYTYLYNGGDVRLFELIENLALMPLTADSEHTWDDDVVVSYFADASAGIQKLLKGMPEDSFEHLYEMSQNWDLSVAELRVAVTAQMLPPEARTAFTTLVPMDSHDADLNPLVDLAKVVTSEVAA